MGFQYKNCYLEGRNEPLMRGNKNLVGGGYCRRMFSSVVMNRILTHGGTPIFRQWGDGEVPLVRKTLIFRLTPI